MSENRPRCAQCEYYYITWDRNHPYGCKQWKIKSNLIPTQAVFNASGKDCQLYMEKVPKTINKNN